MRVKISLDFEDSGDEHPTLQGKDIELDFKPDADKHEVVNELVQVVRDLLQ